jgi:diguanylate cyclase (GGDEF)-like protein
MATVACRVRGLSTSRPARVESDPVSWFNDTRFMSRSLGWLFLLAPSSALLGMLFPHPEYGNPPPIVASALAAIVVGGALLSGRFDRAPHWMFPGFAYLATALVTVVVYATGTPGLGTRFYYLWATPYAFAFFSRRQAVAQTLFVAACSLGALALFVHDHPAVGSFDKYLGLSFASVVTVIVVGSLVRRLTQPPTRGAALSAGIRLGARRLRLRVARPGDPGRQRRAVPDDRPGPGRARRCADVRLVARGRGRRGSPGASPRRTSRSPWSFEARVQRSDGVTRWVSVSAALVTPERGRPYHYALIRDITEHRRDREMLAHQAIHDGLTGAYNRTLLIDRLETALERGRGGVAVVWADLDRFKLVNDSLGHHMGDELLVVAARRLRGALQPGDTLARFGGDEFAVLCEGVRDPMDALARASRMARALEDPIRLTSGSHAVSASFGVAVAEGNRVNSVRLLAHADAAVYRAKARGRGRVEMSDESLLAEVQERLMLERELRVVFDQGQFFIEYQPTVDACTGMPTGLEALVRWRHPALGVVSPADFVPVAEGTGLIVRLGQWVLQRATEDLARWQAALGMQSQLRVAVNISGRQLADVGFVDTVAEAVRTSGIAPGALGLEITESAPTRRAPPSWRRSSGWPRPSASRSSPRDWRPSTSSPRSGASDATASRGSRSRLRSPGTTWSVICASISPWRRPARPPCTCLLEPRRSSLLGRRP